MKKKKWSVRGKARDGESSRGYKIQVSQDETCLSSWEQSKGQIGGSAVNNEGNFMNKGRKVGKGLQSPGKKQLGKQVSRFIVMDIERRYLRIFGLHFLKSIHCFSPALFCRRADPVYPKILCQLAFSWEQPMGGTGRRLKVGEREKQGISLFPFLPQAASTAGLCPLMAPAPARQALHCPGVTWWPSLFVPLVEPGSNPCYC